MDPKTDLHVIVGNGSYGLYYGVVSRGDLDRADTSVMLVRECRHVHTWHGRKGGITSLAAHGPCGPHASDSRVGAPCPMSLIRGVAAIHVCSQEAIDAFAKISW